MNQEKANLDLRTILTPLSQLTDLWFQGMRTWIDVLSAFVPRFTGTDSFTPNEVSVTVSSARPAEVSATLQPGTDYKDLVAGPLGGAKGTQIDSRNLSIKRDQKGNVRLYVKVGKDQPAGTYIGPILNKPESTRVGTITVTIDPDQV